MTATNHRSDTEGTKVDDAHAHTRGEMAGSVIDHAVSDFLGSRHLRQARRQLKQEKALTEALQFDRTMAKKKQARKLSAKCKPSLK